jgi:hypothetical protein
VDLSELLGRVIDPAGFHEHIGRHGSARQVLLYLLELPLDSNFPVQIVA